MRYWLISFGLMFITNFSFATGTSDTSDTPESLRAEAVKLNARIEAAKTNLAKLKENQEKANTNIANLTNKLKAAHCNVEELGNGLSGCDPEATIANADARQMRRDLNKSKKEIDSIGIEIDAINKAGTMNTFAILASEKAGLEAKLAASKNNPVNQQLEALEKKFALQNQSLGLMANGLVLNAKFSDLKMNGMTLSAELDKIDKLYDQSTMGVYLQDKIGALMNSKLLCDSVNKHCIAKEKYTVDRNNLKEIFPYISELNSRSGEENRHRTYEKPSTAK